MSSETNDNKTVRVPTFNGDKEKFQAWWIRFKAYAKVAGFSTAITTDPEVDLPANQVEANSLTGSDANTKKKQAAVSRNDAAMANLTLAFTSDELLGMIITAQTSDWPDGLACDVIKDLFKKYKPEDIMSLVDEKVELAKIRMSPNEEPKKLFDRIIAVETRFNTKTRQIGEAEKIAVVLSQAPKQYQGVLTSEQCLRRGLGLDVTMKDLREVMDQHYRLLNCEEGEDEKETALNFQDTKNKNRGKGRDRKYKSRRRPKRFNGDCNNCGNFSHRARDCWANEDNANK